MNAKRIAEEIRAILAVPMRKVARNKLEGLLKELEYAVQEDEARDKKYEALQEIGRCAALAIAEMVAALECNYDRMEELRDERKALVDATGTAGQTKKQKAAAAAALEEWDEDNAEELKELQEAAGDCESREDAECRIHDDPLSIEVTFDSCEPGATPEVAGFVLLLSTGGPAVRIVGEFGAHNEPRRAWLETQDWGTPWTEYHGDAIDRDALLTYCRQFYFGEI